MTGRTAEPAGTAKMSCLRKAGTFCAAAVLLASLLLSGCGSKAEAALRFDDSVSSSAQAGSGMDFADGTGRDVSVKTCSRVVSLYGSFAEAWMLAGGTLAGTTEDAVRERQLSLGEDVSIVGTVKDPNLEEILSISPDFVILSSEIAAQVSLDSALTGAGVPHAYFSGNTFDSYLSMLRIFCTMTGRDDLYQKNGLDVRKQIDSVLENVPSSGESGPSVLLLRACSDGCEARGGDSIAGAILQDLGARNTEEQNASASAEFSMEQMITDDPEYILITVMGKEDGAKAYFSGKFESDPAWSGLRAVREGHCIFLPKDLFQYKPNARWGESYEYLAELLYPDTGSAQ